MSLCSMVEVMHNLLHLVGGEDMARLKDVVGIFLSEKSAGSRKYCESADCIFDLLRMASGLLSGEKLDMIASQ